MLRTTTHAVTSAHYASFLPDVGKRDVCIVFDFHRYQRDVFELTMHAHASMALDGRDTLVVLDGGGPMAERVEAIAAAVEVGGAQVVRFAERDLGEPLSIFALTAVVQCIALDLAEARGTNPDRFRYDEDGGRAGVRVDRVLTVFTGIDAPPVVVKDMLLYSLTIHQA
jgi:hypothetical protein